MSTNPFSCSNCGVYNCVNKDKAFPRSCLTTDEAYNDLLAESLELYKNDPEISLVAKASAEVEGEYYGRLTRVEEIIVFAKKLGAKKIGIASCMGLIQECKIFVKALEANGLVPYSVICKVGATDKTVAGLPESVKIRPGCHESLCNPVMQAKILNQQQTDLNVVIGLCAGHDSLFIKYSDALVTTLITKDRVLAHNPAAALYASGSYYKRIFEEIK